MLPGRIESLGAQGCAEFAKPCSNCAAQISGMVKPPMLTHGLVGRRQADAQDRLQAHKQKDVGEE